MKTSQTGKGKIASIVGITILVLIAWLYSIQPEDLKPKSDLVVNTDATGQVPDEGIKCFDSSKYFAIQKSIPDSVGSNILVKFKSNSDQKMDCAYTPAKNDFEITNDDAEYFLTFTDNYILIDSGTGPEPRVLIAYNLNTGEKVYTDRYSKPVTTIANTITYWSPSETKPSAENCPDLADFTSKGLGALIESKISVDLDSHSITDSGETECVATQ